LTHKARGHDYRVVSHEEHFRGAVFTLVTDEVAMPGGGTARRDYTRHRPAAAVVALDDDGRVVLVHQYRPALHRYLWELPAGIMDKPGESAVGAAARELAEETDLVAARWDVLVDVHASPGYSDELVRIFLARDLSAVPAARRYAREQEEADLTVSRFDLADAVAMVLRGDITSGPSATGILAALHARDTAWSPLRPPETPLPT
jgi:8-oxo-dGDP phosphatase